MGQSSPLLYLEVFLTLLPNYNLIVETRNKKPEKLRKVCGLIGREELQEMRALIVRLWLRLNGARNFNYFKVAKSLTT